MTFKKKSLTDYCAYIVVANEGLAKLRCVAIETRLRLRIILTAKTLEYEPSKTADNFIRYSHAHSKGTPENAHYHDDGASTIGTMRGPSMSEQKEKKAQNIDQMVQPSRRHSRPHF